MTGTTIGIGFSGQNAAGKTADLWNTVKTAAKIMIQPAGNCENLKEKLLQQHR